MYATLQAVTVNKDDKPLLEVRPDAHGFHVVSLAGDNHLVVGRGFASLKEALDFATKRAQLPPL